MKLQKITHSNVSEAGTFLIGKPGAVITASAIRETPSGCSIVMPLRNGVVEVFAYTFTSLKETVFYNSNLLADTLKFPGNFKIVTDKGINPNGNYELHICAGEDLCGIYYYEKKSQRDNDIERLEDMFEIIF